MRVYHAQSPRFHPQYLIIMMINTGEEMCKECQGQVSTVTSQVLSPQDAPQVNPR